MTKILFITNGHGEDQTAAEIIKNLPHANISVLPMVGRGDIFNSLEVKVLGLRKDLPSGGFSLRNVKSLPEDLKSGLFKNTRKHYGLLRSLKGNFDLVVGIGDIVVILAAMLTKLPFIFVGLNKSEYYQYFGFNYTPWEKWLLKRKAQLVFARDELTANELRNHSIPAIYSGNPMMDCIGEVTVQEKYHNKTIGFLPGTREDASINLQDFISIIHQIDLFKTSGTNYNYLTATKFEKVPEPMLKESFANVLYLSDVIIGLSGTGNEQAAGIGKTVFAFSGQGSQYTNKFSLAQKQLLGNSLLLLPRNVAFIGKKIVEFLSSPPDEHKIIREGQKRMGQPGASKKIADKILEVIKQ